MRSRLGLRQLMVLGVGSVSLLLMLGLSALLMARTEAALNEDAAERLDQLSTAIQTHIRRGVSERLHQVSTLAGESDELWRAGLDTPAAERLVHRLLRASLGGAWVGVADLDGRVAVDAKPLLQGRSVADRPWFQQGLQHAYFGEVHEAKLLAKLLPPPPSGEPLRFVDFAAPIKVDGAVVGVLAMHGHWSWARELVESMIPTSLREVGIEVLLFNAQQQPIYPQILPSAGLPPGLDLGGLHGSPARAWTWADGQDYLSAVGHFQPAGQAGQPGWTIVVRQPTELAHAPAHALAQKLMLMVLAGCALLVGWLWWVLGRLVRPVLSLSRASESVAAGHILDPLPHFGQHGFELARLSRSVEHMRARLVEGQQRLEQVVEDRTRALAEANEALQVLSDTDPLTGLLNRRGLQPRFEAAMALVRRQRSMLSVALFDIDHFKQINDRFGHAAGDAVLQTLGRWMREHFRASDLCARLGGEEFVVVLLECDGATAAILAQRCLDQIGALGFPGVGRVTVSIGVASTDRCGFHLDTLLKAADEALYAAKRAGRNQAVLAVEPPSSLTGGGPIPAPRPAPLQAR